MHMFTLVLVGCVLLVLQQKTDALTCYVCARGSEGCGDPFRNTGSGVSQSSSTESTAQCVKLVSTTNPKSIARVSRTDTSGCVSVTSSDDSTDSYPYCCTTDYCNTGSMGRASLLFAMISTALGLLLVN